MLLRKRHSSSRILDTIQNEGSPETESLFCELDQDDGSRVKINLDRYKIIDGKLYLFYDGFWGDTLEKWNDLSDKTSEAELIIKADRHWSEHI